MKALGQKAADNEKGLRQFDGRIVDWMPQDGNSILMKTPNVRGERHKIILNRI